MSLIERYRVLYEHEKASNDKMLAMIESVPVANRSDARFQQAVVLAGHLAACRENFLEVMDGSGELRMEWWDDQTEVSTLPARFSALQEAWTAYLARLTDEQLPEEFVLWADENQTLMEPVEVQLETMIGHSAYHRGQIALLVDQLGGETVDTDYVFWLMPEIS
jgi:uncharacterized damage-inducible protein DinB